ncbi:hypothetical protein HPB47_027323 [Ixodes persulcatus]|uniref:Uncharacterized protein n=1 Tax=Ixodes persulcatus TaxID=34615 RepID=A0AC60PY92_IXOPE|nr:hypothetical protein HPB47_027323 [Ixodes persulcatus]
MGRSTSVLVALGSFDPPGYLKFMGGRHRFHDYMEKKQACTKCWTLGHRPDTCISSIEGRCPNCGEFHEHPPKSLGVRTEYTCTPKCLICGKQHYTGSRNCMERFKPLRIWQESRTEKRTPLPKKEDFVSLTPGKVDEPKSVQGKSYMQALQKTQVPPQGQDTRTGNETLEKALKQLREELKQLREERQDERVAFEKQLRAERAKYEREINELRRKPGSGEDGDKRDPRRAAPSAPVTSIPAEQMACDVTPESSQATTSFRKRRQRSESEASEVSLADTESGKKAETIAGHNHILVIGDFNAENSSWGYQRDSRKGKKIEEQADTYNAILMNDITAKTRIGNSVQRDTNPDLAFGINIEDYCWTNSRENLGSDHYIIQIALKLDGHRDRNVPKQTYTNWDAFRNLRNEGNRPIQEIEEWAAKLVEDHQFVTRKIENPTQARSMDEKLKNMLDAYKSIYERWLHTGKRYPKLRRRAARLSKEIEVYAQQLNQQLWQPNCDELQGQLHTKNPWPLFRRLLAPEETKTEKRKLLAKIVRDHEGSMDKLFEELKEIYLKSPSRNPIHSKHYAGDGNVELDSHYRARNEKSHNGAQDVFSTWRRQSNKQDP